MNDSTRRITASMLYDLVQCPHRVTMDIHGDPALRDEINPFVQLLWEKGTTHEHDVIDGLDVAVVDLSPHSGEEKEFLTRKAMDDAAPLIHGGRISVDNLLGYPDLLRKSNDGYIAGDIKSGAGEEGDENGRKPKKHYGVQLSLYTDILARCGMGASRRSFVWDIHRDEVTYDLDEPQGKRNPWTMWGVYRDALQQTQGIISRSLDTKPAYGSSCKLCHWYSACLAALEESDDLTLLPELGRAKRDAMMDRIPSISDLASIDVEGYITGRKTHFLGIGPDSLRKFQARARLNVAPDAKPYLKAPLTLPLSDTELFFDIEVDPMRDFCYLHGFVERRGGDNTTEKYTAFFTDAVHAKEEERAFSEAWQYIVERQPCVVHYYSKYERTIWRKLQSKYPRVCSTEDIEDLFDPARSVDLYFDVVKKATEWPTKDHSIKTLATFLGFEWRDTHPSGAASIEWFDQWARSGDPSIKGRILEYNEDDCIATRALLDGIRELPYFE
uniref:RecB family nuclease, putative, TM0106 family n=1 Tax=Candidatus Kentrum sp. LFY TaxID=2126342 RepID=A0A450WQV1_9GAMM|nr:MAG: RecB family nuclease, putative, TM0106 family [Candidatus Kentron sp. LFY]